MLVFSHVAIRPMPITITSGASRLSAWSQVSS
jgi:membrane protein YqaA with SNARE-associated domain